MPGMTVAQEASGAALSPTVSRAAEQLFHEHSGWLYGYCLRLLRSPEEAEDAVQATYLNACRSLGRGTRPRAGSAWLLHIARNVCFTRIRSARRRDGVERVGDVTVLEETVAAPDRSYDSLLGLTEALLSFPNDSARRSCSASGRASRTARSRSGWRSATRPRRRSFSAPGARSPRRSRTRASAAGSRRCTSSTSARFWPAQGPPRGRRGRQGRHGRHCRRSDHRDGGRYRSPGLPGARAGARGRAGRATRPPRPLPRRSLGRVAPGFSTAPLPGGADGPAFNRPGHGRAQGQATAEEAKANGPNGNANGNANGPESGKALGKAKARTPTLPPTANGQGTPASGRSKAPAQSTPSEPAARWASREAGPPAESRHRRTPR